MVVRSKTKQSETRRRSKGHPPEYNLKRKNKYNTNDEFRQRECQRIRMWKQKKKKITTVCTAKETQRSTGVTCSCVTNNDPTVLKKEKREIIDDATIRTKIKGVCEEVLFK